MMILHKVTYWVSSSAQGTIQLLQWEYIWYHCYRGSMTITTDCYCWSLPGYNTTVTVGVMFMTYTTDQPSIVRLLLLPQTLAGHCQGTIPLLQCESMTSLLVTARVWELGRDTTPMHVRSHDVTICAYASVLYLFLKSLCLCAFRPHLAPLPTAPVPCLPKMSRKKNKVV